jgi:MoxR-like ATPase
VTPNWSLLAPHRPVDSGGDQYVPPPSNIGEAMARWVLASGAPVLLGGPTGVGKSTELAQVAALLERDAPYASFSSTGLGTCGGWILTGCSAGWRVWLSRT